MITRSGSLAIVNIKRANAGPNAINAHPKNTATVIASYLYRRKGREDQRANVSLSLATTSPSLEC